MHSEPSSAAHLPRSFSMAAKRHFQFAGSLEPPQTRHKAYDAAAGSQWGAAQWAAIEAAAGAPLSVAAHGESSPATACRSCASLPPILAS
jgi:hypothetical protein